MASWERVLVWVHENLGIEPSLTNKVTLTLVVLLLLGWIRAALNRVAARRIEDPDRRYTVIKGIGVAHTVALVIVLFRVWIDASGLGTYLGILSAGLAIALQEPIQDLAGWLFIQLRRPYRVGDRVEIGTEKGDVIDVGPFMTTMVEVGNWVDADQTTGRLLHVPNGWVFRHRVSNQTEGFPFVWAEVPVTVTFESDWRRCRALLEEIGARLAGDAPETAARAIRQGAAKYRLHYRTLTPSVWTRVDASGVTLTLRILSEARQIRGVISQVWEEFLAALPSEPIELAYPTVRQFRRWEETGDQPPGD